jgi:hypothetical protein
MSGLIDYAGLFPPASLDLPAATRNYAAYRASEHAWILGRFVVPTARRDEVDPSWPLALLDPGPPKREIAGDVVYVEIPVRQVADLPSNAKIRLGGDVIPVAASVAKFLLHSAAVRLPFKATAGLHHPLRNPPMHGFVNLFLAAALAWRGEDPLSTLEERDAAAFHFADDAVRWHDHVVTAAELHDVRQKFAISFGSCSFEEPIADLQTLGWL